MSGISDLCGQKVLSVIAMIKEFTVPGLVTITNLDDDGVSIDLENEEYNRELLIVIGPSGKAYYSTSNLLTGVVVSEILESDESLRSLIQWLIKEV